MYQIILTFQIKVLNWLQTYTIGWVSVAVWMLKQTRAMSDNTTEPQCLYFSCIALSVYL